ncbi:hypothetical protein LTR28_002045, partial [Elasticomyces elasticus]
LEFAMHLDFSLCEPESTYRQAMSAIMESTGWPIVQSGKAVFGDFALRLLLLALKKSRLAALSE